MNQKKKGKEAFPVSFGFTPQKTNQDNPNQTHKQAVVVQKEERFGLRP
jgi:hypothetical protein